MHEEQYLTEEVHKEYKKLLKNIYDQFLIQQNRVTLQQYQIYTFISDKFTAENWIKNIFSMGGAVCTKIDEVGPKTKDQFEIDFDMEQAVLIEMTDKYKLFRIKRNKKLKGRRGQSNGVNVQGKKKKGEEDNIEGEQLTVKFENHVIYPGNVIGSYLPKEEKLLNLEPHKNIIKIHDIYSWEESKSVLEQVFIIDNIESTLRQELRMMELKNLEYSDEELLKFIEDIIQGLEFLRRKGLSVIIDVDHIYKVENDYKWVSYESIGLYDHPMPISHELNEVFQLIMIIIKKIFRSNEVSVLRAKHQKSWRLIQQIQQYMEQSLSNEFYQKFYHLVNTIKDLDGGYLYTKIVEEINIKINMKNQQELVEQLKKYKPHELNLEVDGKDDLLWKTVCEELRKMIELKSLELKSENNMIQSSRASDIFLEVSNSCRMLDNLYLKWSDNMLDSNFWHYLTTYFSQFEFMNLKLELKNNYLSSQYNYLRSFLANQSNMLITLHIDLENNQITKSEAGDLAEGLSKLQMLQQLNLNLSNNYISNIGYVDLIAGISNLSYISSLILNFSKCYIEFDGFLATDLLGYLDNLTELKLDLSYNSLKRKSMMPIDFKRNDRFNAHRNRTEFFNNLRDELSQFPQTGTIVVNPQEIIDDRGTPLPQPPSLIEEMDENSSRGTQTKIKGFLGTNNTLYQNSDDKNEVSIFNSESRSNLKSDPNLQGIISSTFKDKIGSSNLLAKQSRQVNQVKNTQSKGSSLRRIEEEIKTENSRRQNLKKNPFSFINNPELHLINLNLDKTDLSDEHIALLCERLQLQREKIKNFQLNISLNNNIRDFSYLAETIMSLKECIELDINCDKSYFDIPHKDFFEFHLQPLLGLRKLALNFNYVQLKFNQMVNLFQSIQYLSELTQLELQFFENQLENAGFSMLGESLKNLKKLVVLKLHCYNVKVISDQSLEESENQINLNQQTTQTNIIRKNFPSSAQSTQLLQLQFNQQSHTNSQSPQFFDRDQFEYDQQQQQHLQENENLTEHQQQTLKDFQLGTAQSSIIASVNPSQQQSINNINTFNMISNNNIQQQQQLQLQSQNNFVKQQSIAQSMNSPIHDFASPLLANMSDNTLHPLCKSISQMNNLQVLSVCLSHNQIGSHGMQLFSSSLVNKPNLKELNLSFRRCSIENFYHLFVAINSFGSSLKILKLNIQFNYKLNVSIVQANNYFQNMQIEDLSLHFEDNYLDEQAIASLATNLQFLSQSLTSLSLSLNQLSKLQDIWLIKLFQGISQCTKLESLKLDLQRNQEIVSISGIEKLSELINLKSYQVKMQNCAIDYTGGHNIGVSLSYLEPKLQILNLNFEINGISSSTGIASPGLISIANNLNGLSGCLKQLTLNVVSNSIEESAFQKLFYSISELCELTKLDLNLSKNSIGALSPSVFIFLIPLKCRLKYLSLSLRKTQITSSMCNSLFTRMSKLTNILEISLDLSGNMLERSFHLQYQHQYKQQQQQQLINIVSDGNKMEQSQNIQPEIEQQPQIQSNLLVPGHTKGLSATSVQSIPKLPSAQQIVNNVPQEKQQERPFISHQHNPSQPSFLQIVAQLQNKHSSSTGNIPYSIPINPFDTFPDAIRNMPHLCSLRIDILQNMSTYNNSLFSITHGIVNSCIKIHHIKVRCEKWSSCYHYFMLYFIEVRNQIQSILSRNKLLLTLPNNVITSIIKDWEFLYDLK